MTNKLYVGNLSFGTSVEMLTQIFSVDGMLVKHVNLIVDRETGKSRGFAFITMEDNETVQKAISVLNGKEADGRFMRISEAKEKVRSSRGTREQVPTNNFSRRTNDGPRPELSSPPDFLPKEDSRRKNSRKPRRSQRRKEEEYY